MSGDLKRNFQMRKFSQILKSIGQYVGYLLVRFFCFVVAILPKNVMYKLADILGLFAYYADRKHRNIVINNLRYVFEDKYKDKEIKKIAKDVFKNQSKNLFEFLLFPRISEEDIKNMMFVENIEYIDEALSYGRGVILISAHLGNWELGLMRLAIQNYILNVVIRPISDKKMDEFVKNIRKARGIKMIPRTEASKELYYSCLKNNEILVLAIDQYAGGKGITIDFLGKPSLAFCGWVVIHQKIQAPIVLIFCKRNRNNTHTLTIEKPIFLEFTGNKEADLYNNTVLINKIIEEKICEDPSQWFWLHQKWRI